jgi:signal transduction histidine kinase/CheY-like chemotaxis protein
MTGSEVLALRRELDYSNQGLIALHAELSERQDELECARAAAEQAGKDKADFLANMSHEIRSPMNAVIGFIGLLRSTELTAEQAEYTEVVVAAATHLLGVIDGILDLSKIESGFLELEEIPFDLFACVEDAVDMLTVLAKEKNLVLTALFAPGLPASIVGDPLRLRQVLVNLLANAVKFTIRGHVIVEVTQLDVAQQADLAQQADPGSARQLAFHVRDTGGGIPAERVERLFAPYTQADASTARIHGGTGLGLTICRQLTEQMGGTITVGSTVGEGSTFTVTIGTRLGPGPADSDVCPAGTQILVVGQHALHADAIVRHLASWGAQPVTAPTIDAAVSRPGDWPRAALAIIDASRPVTLASDIARLTAAGSDPDLPFICVAAMDSRALRPAAELWPSVRTPIHRDQLRHAVLAALGHRSNPPAAAPAAPAAPAAAPTALAAVPAARTAAPAALPSARQVLYVDDDPLLAGLVERIFAADPAITVQTAPDGPTALSLAIHQQPDIILLDLHIAGTSGETLLQQLQADARTQAIPVVIVSGDTAPAIIQRLIGLGAVAYLTKPFTSSQLRDLVSRLGRPPGQRDGRALADDPAAERR